MAKWLLVQRGGETDKTAGSLVGALVSKYEPTMPELMLAVDATWAVGSEDPHPYLIKTVSEIVARRKAPGGLIDAPSERQQVSWMEDLRENEFSWRPERGPRPGQPGCRVSAEIQRRYGFEPAPALAGAAA